MAASDDRGTYKPDKSSTKTQRIVKDKYSELFYVTITYKLIQIFYCGVVSLQTTVAIELKTPFTVI